MKKLTAREIIDNILTVKGLDQNELAMQSGIIPNTLVKAISRNRLTDEIVMKIHDSFGVRKEFLKTGEGEIFDENPTPAINLSDSTVNEPHALYDKEGVYTNLIERNTNYQILPTRLLNEYKIIPNNMIDTHDTEIKAMDKAIAAQDRVISRYELEIKDKEMEIQLLRSEIEALRAKLGTQPTKQ